MEARSGQGWERPPGGTSGSEFALPGRVGLRPDFLRVGVCPSGSGFALPGRGRVGSDFGSDFGQVSSGSEFALPGRGSWCPLFAAAGRANVTMKQGGPVHVL